MSRRAGRAAPPAPLLVALCFTPAAAQDAGPGRAMPDRGQQHVPLGEPVSYPEYPPTSGPHWPRWALWGVHAEPVEEELFDGVDRERIVGFVRAWQDRGPEDVP